MVSLRFLVLGPGIDGPLLVLLGPQTKIGRPEKINRCALARRGIEQSPLLHRKGAAGVGAVGIHAAAVRRQEGAGALFIIGHAQQDFRKEVALPKDHIHVPFDEFIRIHLQAVF